MTATGLSYTYHNGTGALDTFAIGIDYISEAHLAVSVGGTPQVDPTDYSVVGADVVFITPPGSGTDNVKIIRSTPRELANRQVDFVNNTGFSEAQLELMQKQLILTIQESLETSSAGQITPGAEFISYDTTRAMWLAGRSAVDTGLGDLAAPTSDDEAATKKYVDDIAVWGIAGIPQSWALTGVTSQTNFTLTAGPNLDEEMVIVSVDGALQRPVSDFTISKASPDSTLVFGVAPANGAVINVQNFGNARFLSGAGLEDNSVATAKLQDLAVTAAKIANLTITDGKLAALTITAASIAANAITAAKILAGEITYDKLDTTVFTAAPGGSYDQAIVIDKDNGNQALRGLLTTDLSDYVSRLATMRLDQLAAPNTSLAMGTQKITGVVDPGAAQDAATKNYVDTQVAAGASSGIVLLHDETLGGDTTEWELSTGAWISTTYQFYTFVMNHVGWALGTFAYHLKQGSYTWSHGFTSMVLSPISAPKLLGWKILPPTASEYAHHQIEYGATAITVSGGPEVLGVMTQFKFKASVANGLKTGSRIKIYGHKAL